MAAATTRTTSKAISKKSSMGPLKHGRRRILRIQPGQHERVVQRGPRPSAPNFLGEGIVTVRIHMDRDAPPKCLRRADLSIFMFGRPERRRLVE